MFKVLLEIQSPRHWIPFRTVFLINDSGIETLEVRIFKRFQMVILHLNYEYIYAMYLANGSSSI